MTNEQAPGYCGKQLRVSSETCTLSRGHRENCGRAWEEWRPGHPERSTYDAERAAPYQLTSPPQPAPAQASSVAPWPDYYAIVEVRTLISGEILRRCPARRFEVYFNREIGDVREATP